MTNRPRFKRLIAILLLVPILVTAASAEPEKSECPQTLTVELTKRGVPKLYFTQPQIPRGDKIWRMTLLRSTSNLEGESNLQGHPIASQPLAVSSRDYTDIQAPERVTLSYRLRTDTASGQKIYSNVVRVRCPEYKIDTLEDPYLLIDKLKYALLVYDGDRLMRSLPIALGGRAQGRKLHFDRASTPEGVYRVYALQPQATFYRAMDLNYPNLCDQTRLDFFEAAGLISSPAPNIGGEIQIHGQGIAHNWTWGCIALRNSDMDWLFSRPEFSVGLTVYVAGSELTPDDLQRTRKLTLADRDFFRQRLQTEGQEPGRTESDFIWALCQYQLDSNLVVTGVLDGPTIKRLAPRFGERSPR